MPTLCQTKPQMTNSFKHWMSECDSGGGTCLLGVFMLNVWVWLRWGHMALGSVGHICPCVPSSIKKIIKIIYLNCVSTKINAIQITYYIFINIFIFFLYLENKLKLKYFHRYLWALCLVSKPASDHKPLVLWALEIDTGKPKKFQYISWLWWRLAGGKPVLVLDS